MLEKPEEKITTEEYSKRKLKDFQEKRSSLGAMLLTGLIESRGFEVFIEAQTEDIVQQVFDLANEFMLINENHCEAEIKMKQPISNLK